MLSPSLEEARSIARDTASTRQPQRHTMPSGGTAAGNRCAAANIHLVADETAGAVERVDAAADETVDLRPEDPVAVAARRATVKHPSLVAIFACQTFKVA